MNLSHLPIQDVLSYLLMRSGQFQDFQGKPESLQPCKDMRLRTDPGNQADFTRLPTEAWDELQHANIVLRLSSNLSSSTSASALTDLSPHFQAALMPGQVSDGQLVNQRYPRLLKLHLRNLIFYKRSTEWT